jgi:ornithine cyclodeaminase/alanine dehydrogenase-like protein (mu-crystallin family)
MISVFPRNQPPFPSVTATLFLFNIENGQLKAVVEATEITAWRTSATSLVATEHLYFRRVQPTQKLTLAILGTGEQGRAHAFGFLTFFHGKFERVQLWNRSKEKAEKLKIDLQEKFRGVVIEVFEDSKAAVSNADVIVTATSAKNPLFDIGDIKKVVHLNPIGTNGMKFYPELDPNIYEAPQSKIYVESWVNAKNELKDLERFICAEVGEVITGRVTPDSDITIFQSVGEYI